jgi:DNA-binding transcriptional ArsR family regulator/uncharacterized protein YndB with AHSA1/START domain
MNREAADIDLVFKALADPTRRNVLDRLRERNGQTLTELSEQTGMARQSVTQHLDVLGAANLVAVVRRGRERLHYLNPFPIHELQARWITAFDQPRLDAITTIKDRAEETAMNETLTIPDYVYVTYIKASADQVWQALTDADLTTEYWGQRNESDWKAGSEWNMLRPDGSGTVVTGVVVESDPPRRLMNGPSVVTFLVECDGGVVRLTVEHANLPNADFVRGISGGWPAILANLKSLLETGAVLPTPPWAMSTDGAA